MPLDAQIVENKVSRLYYNILQNHVEIKDPLEFLNAILSENINPFQESWGYQCERNKHINPSNLMPSPLEKIAQLPNTPENSGLKAVANTIETAIPQTHPSRNFKVCFDPIKEYFDSLNP